LLATQLLVKGNEDFGRNSEIQEEGESQMN